MSKITLDKIKESYFLFGCLKEDASPFIKEQLNEFNGQIKYAPVDGFGYYFFTLPFYAEKAETDEIVLIKLGNFHDGENLISAQNIVNHGWVSKDGLNFDLIKGDGALVWFRKNEPRCFIYRNVLSASVMHYLENEDQFIASDNLRLASLFQSGKEFSEIGIVQHYMSRHTFGRETYFKGISRLMVGEMLTWIPSSLSIELGRDFKTLFNPHNHKSVSVESSNWYFERLKHVVGIYLNGRAMSCAMLLSGGVDSSLVQATINANLDNGAMFPSFSYLLDSPGFAYEVEYAREATRALNTKHTFIELAPLQYVQGIIQCIEILGEPPTDDARLCFYLLSEYISKNFPEIKYFFHGAYADGFNGGAAASRALQGDKYRALSGPLLKFLATILSPFSQSKSYGARTAAEILNNTKDISSKDHFLNSIDTYSDWEFVEKCFPPDLISDALQIKRSIEYDYLNSKYFVEQVSMLDTLISGVSQHAMERSLGYFSKVEFIYPYGDERIIEASGTFTPFERYVCNHRTKPVLKFALESQTSNFELDKPKGWSGYGMVELFESMKSGALSELVQDIERPGFITRADFEEKLRQPDWFTWNMLTLDLLMKYIPNSV